MRGLAATRAPKCAGADVSRSLVPDSGLASTECGLYDAVFRETQEEPFERPVSNLVINFSGSLLLQDRVAVHSQNVVDATDTKTYTKECKFCLRVLTQLDTFVHPPLPKSWSSIKCRGPTATPSVMLPAVTVETLAVLCTSPSLHSRDDFRFMWVSLCSNYGIGDVELLQVRRHQDRVTQNVTVVYVPQVRQAPHLFLQRTPRMANFSRPPNWKLESVCILLAGAPIHGRLPDAC